jgi:predicted TIM-barrel fold metal-dependent hydrolase
MKELRTGKENGAVGVFFRGIERDLSLADPYFFPIYEEARRLNLPISIHTGAGCPAFTHVFKFEISFTFAPIRMPPLMAFRDLVANRIPEQFPGLRFGFIEAEASWVPYLLHNLGRFYRLLRDEGRKAGPRLFQEYGLFVACEADEDLPYLLDYVGENNLIIGSDYGHNDQSFEDNMARTLRAREDVPSRVIEKILCENPRSFYAL